MMQSINHRISVRSIDKDSEALYLIRPPSLKKIKEILERCKNCKEFYVGRDTYNRLSGKVKEFIKQNNIKLRLEKAAGRPLEIELEKLYKVIELYNERFSLREIEKELNVPKSTVHYLLKYAERGKLRGKNREVVYLGQQNV